ncbi:MAG: RdgB/HAM1 family non-canonical purine NTP pyrophosphatase [Actinomycetota bacterium]|nr:RdgB/HAM1 family non-canonical purine NTP pyrophosphatase [Actinomycetota bacterium]
MRIVLATRNRGKLAELERILAGLDVELVPIDLFGGQAPEEAGDTFEENALTKARAAVIETGLPALGDDSGLEVDVLRGGPGVVSARYAGAHADDAANRAKLLAALAGVPPERRSARFVCVAVLVSRDGREWITRGVMEGHITTEPRGKGGFGYDPVFVALGENRTNAELPAEVKDARSHRGSAFRALRPTIEALLSES